MKLPEDIRKSIPNINENIKTSISINNRREIKHNLEMYKKKC